MNSFIDSMVRQIPRQSSCGIRFTDVARAVTRKSASLGKESALATSGGADEKIDGFNILQEPSTATQVLALHQPIEEVSTYIVGEAG